MHGIQLPWPPMAMCFTKCGHRVAYFICIMQQLADVVVAYSSVLEVLSPRSKHKAMQWLHKTEPSIS
jgi:hypothetical protein